MAREQLDEKDVLLLKALKENARASLVALARTVGLSRSATHDRITRLEEKGVIKGYTITIETDVISNARAFLCIDFATSVAQKELAYTIGKLPGVEAAYCLSGDLDMLAYCECASTADLATLRDQVSKLDGVTKITTRHVLAVS